MSSHIALQLAGCEVWLLADKAIYWPEQQTLLIADLHLGKAATYRQLGQPVPHGTTADNFLRLDQLLQRYTCQRLIVLGDFLHARQAQNTATLQALGDWRRRHAALAITLIRGNHDRHAGDPPPALSIETVAEPLLLGPFALQHEPHAHASHHVLAGHVHPAYRLHGRGRQSLRLPCFVVGERVSLLPSFGSFTGGFTVRAQVDEKVFVVGDGGIWEAPRSGS
ncbi:ligase-associated DNA damage response endonuclease PdeM [Pseudomonas turukhanskensis]|uniref:DEAD/DEAH box helicase n=1 Tax=Pseudomonas turukhanskensis TaxID=1806536 RepID=A0A9W6K9T0_9PSED|nr:ligase-associated DNA damage response endonuclease PdeM [Pseudomonas turukhanskensis]GLK90305.1 DEAD/DEAH box helicase [Pseudomonas turukhanskensis]